jgi:hypothetical protein
MSVDMTRVTNNARDHALAVVYRPGNEGHLGVCTYCGSADVSKIRLAGHDSIVHFNITSLTFVRWNLLT